MFCTAKEGITNVKHDYRSQNIYVFSKYSSEQKVDESTQLYTICTQILPEISGVQNKMNRNFDYSQEPYKFKTALLNEHN